MRLIIDIDNVLVDWQMSWIRKYEQEFQRRVPWSERGKWDCYKTGTFFNNYDQFSEWLGNDFWYEINDAPIPGAHEAIRIWKEQHDVLLATHRPVGAPMDAAYELAKKLGLGLKVVFAAPLEKAELKGDVWVDDSPELLWELKRRGKIGVRFVCPWNEGAPGLPLDDWHQFPLVIHIARGKIEDAA